MNKALNFGGSIVSWFFGLVVFAIGLVNTFWGNDPGFGLFLILLSFVYFPAANRMLKLRTGYSIPILVKFSLAIFIIVAALGVGKLFDKIDLMMMDI
ncbi:hypothetical protein [Rufibacter tibetensis]|uniref:Uncharacterized protein n=1 Tax=Rufibacter tibetensis TaxID=512763 RepID=A0A0P0D1Z3_9BACT|nr:hypothetical protein [Rufibacter tibetensis]ALJ00915.1 hypothetical protein DC20_20380 [Rufibacter tibetensis]